MKVNSAMAILQGLQQIQNVLQKESAASLLLTRNAQVANTAATVSAGAAQRALNAIMAFANPITLAVVAAITALTAAYKFFTAGSQAATESLKKFNLQQEVNQQFLDGEIDGIKDNSEKRLAELEVRRARELNFTQTTEADKLRALRIGQNADLAQRKESEQVITEQIAVLSRERAKIQEVIDANALKARQSTDSKFIEEFNKVRDRQEEVDREYYSLTQELEITQLNNVRASIQEQLQLRQQLASLAREQEENRLRQAIAGLKLEQGGLDESRSKYVLLQQEIERLTGQLNALGKTGNERLLEIADAAERAGAAVRSLTQTVSTEERKTTDNTRIEGQKRIEALGEINNRIIVSEEDRAKALRELRRMEFQELLANINIATGIAQEGASLLGDFFDQEADRQDDLIEQQQARLEGLREAGAITEKEFSVRQRRLEQDQRKANADQARRTKAVSIFEATINTFTAATKALTSNSPPLSYILAAATTAFGLARVAFIARQKIPSFGTGKKNNYEGWAEVGETGLKLSSERVDLSWLRVERSLMCMPKTRSLIRVRQRRCWIKGRIWQRDLLQAMRLQLQVSWISITTGSAKQ